MIFHVHIPKTAGTALNQHVLLHAFPRADICLLYDGPKRQDVLAKMSVEQLRSLKLVLGHVPYGFLTPFKVPAVHLSLFREPDSRFGSYVNFLMSEPRHGFWHQSGITFGSADGDTIVQAISHLPHFRLRHQGVMTKLAAGLQLSEQVHEEDWPGLVGRAVENLRRDDYLWGLQDRFTDFCTMLHSRFGLVYHDQPFALEQMSKKRPVTPDDVAAATKRFDHKFRFADLSTDTKALAADLNRYDYQLYERLLAMA